MRHADLDRAAWAADGWEDDEPGDVAGSAPKERGAAQGQFLDLCRVPGMPTPAEAAKTGAFSTCEKEATKSAGGQGFAEVWWTDRFARESAGHCRDEQAAFRQGGRFARASTTPIAPFLMLPFGITLALVVLERIEPGRGGGPRDIADRR